MFWPGLAVRACLACLLLASPWALAGCGAGSPGRPPNGRSVVAFWAAGSHQSLSALERAPAIVTAVAPFTASVDANGSVHQRPSANVLTVSRRLGIAATPLFNSPSSEGFLRRPAARAPAVREIAAVVRREGFPGLHIDFEPPHARDAAALATFVGALRRPLPHAAIYLDIVPASGGAYDWRQLTPLLTGYALMSYDQHAPGTAPGPVAATPLLKP